MVLRVARFCVLMVILLPCHARAAEPDMPFRAPAGFEVSLFAGDDLAHDINSMTIDSRGRVVVAGRGYVKILHDADRDGRADAATLFSDRPGSGAHGLVFEGSDLLCTGDNSVMWLRDTNSDGRADRSPETWAKLKHPEHGANGLVRGPDGWFYLACGNDAGVNADLLTTQASPVKQPRCGAVVRFSPDGDQIEVVAHGFRNPYDLAFGPAAALLLVDSDNEREHYLPWYAPMRLFDIAIGREHGWLERGWQQSWNRPASFFDSAPRLAEVGRGSPTGIVVYQHMAFPERYRGGVFSACWTLGRVYFFPLQREAEGWTTQPEVFLEPTGEEGFAPVDLAVGPSGDLYVAVGGRGTRGSVFRVRAVDQHDAATHPNLAPLEQVLRAPQPLASWSRARWAPAAKQLGREPFESAAAERNRPVAERLRAIEILTELFGGLNAGAFEQLLVENHPQALATAAWSFSRRAEPRAAQALVRLTYHEHPLVQRAAWEGLLSTTKVPSDDDSRPDWARGLGSGRRRVRAAAVSFAAGAGRESYDAYSASITDRPSLEERLARLWVKHERGEAKPDELFAGALDLFMRSAPKPDPRNISGEVEFAKGNSADAVRLMQLGLGDVVRGGQPEVFGGYRADAAEGVPIDRREQATAALLSRFPSGDDVLDREMARLAAMLEVRSPRLVAKFSSKWTEMSEPAEDIHYLISAARLLGDSSEQTTKRIARVLVGLHKKMVDRGYVPSRNWPLRLGELFTELCRRDPQLAEAVVAQPGFGRPEHALFVTRLPPGSAIRTAAARRLLMPLQEDPDAVWGSQLISALAVLPPDELFPFLRQQWTPARRDLIAPVLARAPQEVDRELYVEALNSFRSDTLVAAARALRHLEKPCNADELAAAIFALRRAEQTPDSQAAAAELESLLDLHAGDSGSSAENRSSSLVADEKGKRRGHRAWLDWLSQQYPEQASRLEASLSGGEDWQRRLNQIAWEKGSAQRGREVFERRSCHACHQAAGRLGPDLAGAAARFSRADLLAAVVDPNRDIAPLYRTTLIVTASGKVYHGLIVYESPEGTLLETGPDSVVRIANDEVVDQRPSDRSLMPEGLLDGATDQELADLYAYLKSPGERK